MEPSRSFDRYTLFADLKPRRAPRPEGVPARTFLALDRETGETVVLQAVAAEGEAVEHFLASGQRTRAANPPALPTLLAAGHSDGHAFVTHEWVAGVSLREILQVVAPGEELARHLVLELARGLASLHGQELLHADLHPDNLLLRPDGHLVLAGHFPPPLGAPATTLTPEMVSPRYTAPEVLDGRAPTSASDVYSAGLLAFEAVAAQRLLRTSGAAELRMDLDLLDSALEGLLEKSQALDGGLRSLLAQSLRADPTTRLASGTEFLAEYMSQVPVAQAAPRYDRLQGLASRVSPQVTRGTLERVRNALEDLDLARTITELWRYAAMIPGTDRTRKRSGYLATMEVIWLCLIRSSEGPEGRAEACAAAFLVHRLAKTWGSRSLRLLATELCHRFAPEGSPLPGLLEDTPLSAEGGRARMREYHQALASRPRSEKALLGLTVFTPDIEPRPTETVGGLKARVLAHHSLYRQALFYRCRDILDQEDTRAVITDITDLLTRAREVDTVQAAAGGAATSRELDFSAVHGETEDLDVSELEERQRQLEAEEAASRETDPLAAMDSSPSSGMDTLRRSRYEDLDQSSPELPYPASPPSSPSASVPMNDARELFEEGREKAREGDVRGAATAFHELLGAGLLQREFYFSGVCGEIRNLLWTLLLRPSQASYPAAVALWELTVEAELENLVPLCESLLADALEGPGGRAEDADLEALLQRRPGSLPLRELAARRAEAAGQSFPWARHLAAAAQEHLERRELAEAARLIMAAKSAAVTPELEEQYAAMFELATRTAHASARLAELRARDDLDAAAAYATANELAEKLPGFEPVMEFLADQARSAGYGSRAGDLLLELGRSRYLRGDTQEARRFFHQVLQTEFENEEALLYLAALSREEHDLPESPEVARPTLLAREGLLEAAMHRALQALGSAEHDQALRELLVDVCVQLGRDPSRHRLGLGLLALGAGDHGRARDLCDQAFAESPHPSQLVEVLLRVPNAERIYSRVELARHRGE